MRSFFRLFILILLSAPAISVAQTTRSHGMFWGRLILSDHLSSKWKCDLVLQKRTQNIPDKKNIFGSSHVASAGLWFNYSISPEFKIAVCPFSYFNTYPFLSKPGTVENPGIKEFRWSARLEHEKLFKGFRLTNRYATEYRRRDIHSDNIFLPAWRMRYELRLDKSLSGNYFQRRSASLFVHNEIFIQFGKAVRKDQDIFDQNRIGAGIAFELLQNVRASVSYLNFYQERVKNDVFDIGHCLCVSFTLDNLFVGTKKFSQPGLVNRS